jgi:hypothetical protein
VGIDSGADEDLLREEFREFIFLALGVGEGLDLGVKNALGVVELLRPRTARARGGTASSPPRS